MLFFLYVIKQAVTIDEAMNIMNIVIISQMQISKNIFFLIIMSRNVI
jgi:hypothetical protein